VTDDGFPFQEQIDFFRRKIAVDTRTWTDLWQSAHVHGFMVAGATRDDVLTDLQRAVEKAIVKGATLEGFRKDFDAAVARTGWTYTGQGSDAGRAWRTAVIYRTNLTTSYAAGRHAQMTDPAFLAHSPWWRYIHTHVAHPRPVHLSWHGTVLRHDHPWWGIAYPPNGWGCQCRVEALSDREVEALGGPSAAAPEMKTYEWSPKGRGVTITVPVGIDPGWAYNPALGKEPPPPAGHPHQMPFQALPGTPAYVLAQDRQARKLVLDEGARTGREWVAVYDRKTGTPVAKAEGTGTNVTLPDSVAKSAADPAARLVVHHNHPNGLALSRADLNVLMQNPGIVEVAASGPDGSAFRASRGPKSPEFSKAITAATTKARRLLAKARADGRITDTDARRLESLLVIRDLIETRVIDGLSLPGPDLADLFSRLDEEGE
jgi:hypothetical protein